MSALRIDETSGLEERLELVDTPRGRLYTWSARPPGATSCVIVCSPMLADFTANYDRERTLGHALAARGVGAYRFHYAGEGNSGGSRRDMTLSTMLDDAGAVLDDAMASGFTRLGFLGTRIGALVAAGAASRVPDAPLALWEPVNDPQRFLVEARRADKISRTTRGLDGTTGDWRQELDGAGRIELVGYDVYKPMVDSLGEANLVALAGDQPRPVFLARFRAGAGISEPIHDGLVDAGFPVDLRNYALNESWWFHNSDEGDHNQGGLVGDTVSWFGERLEAAG